MGKLTVELKDVRKRHNGALIGTAHFSDGKVYSFHGYHGGLPCLYGTRESRRACGSIFKLPQGERQRLVRAEIINAVVVAP